VAAVAAEVNKGMERRKALFSFTVSGWSDSSYLGVNLDKHHESYVGGHPFYRDKKLKQEAAAELGLTGLFFAHVDGSPEKQAVLHTAVQGPSQCPAEGKAGG
jgi:hypothetical protein